jgi:hypothetical protein
MPTASQLLAFLKRYWLAFAITAIFVAFGVAYVAGFRISTGFTLVRVGTLEIGGLPRDATVYVDYGQRGTSSTGVMRIPLVPGNHTIIVSENGANPWETIASVATNQTTTVNPILIPVKPGIAPLSADDAKAASAAFAAARVPSAMNPLDIGCSLITVDSNRIIASAATSTPNCTTPAYLCAAGSCAPTIVYSPIAAVRAVAAYPGRTDAILVVAGDTLYALGLDPRTPQAFAPLLSAPGVMMAALPNGSVVVRNASGTYGLSL